MVGEEVSRTAVLFTAEIESRETEVTGVWWRPACQAGPACQYLGGGLAGMPVSAQHGPQILTLPVVRLVMITLFVCCVGKRGKEGKIIVKQNTDLYL